MKQLWKEFNWFWKQKLYVITVVITAICGYGFSIVQPSIGIDDTAIGLYIEDGLAVVMGRWTVFLLNKLFHMSEFAPFMLEIIGTCMLCIGVTLFCVLFRRILGERIGIEGYAIFSCIFISNPIISEVDVYYFHNGMDLAYILTALSLLAFMEAMDSRGKSRWWKLLSSMLFIWVAAGCYESMIIVFILGLLLIMFLRGMTGQDRITFWYLCKTLLTGAILVIGAMLLRSVAISLVIKLFHLENMVGLMNLRSVTEAFALLAPGQGLETLKMLLKRYWVVYFVNAFVYLPITGYVFAVAVTGVAALITLFRKKNGWYLLLCVGMLIPPVLLTLIEVRPTAYRSCQYMPLFTAFGMLLLYWGSLQLKRMKWLRYVCVAIAVILVYNQATELNKSFYVDYKKYENTKDVLTEIAWEIEKKYGNEVPVVFTGHYETPYSIVQDYYVSYSSWQYRCIARITDLVDGHLKEKYFTEYGYSFIGEANNPFIQWGFDAFDGTNRQIMNFLEMHGHSFPLVTDESVLENARAIGETMPEWPAEGSVCLQDGYVLVNL